MALLDLIEIVCDDVTRVDVDLLVLKFAEGWYGADAAVARAIRVSGGAAGADHDREARGLFLDDDEDAIRPGDGIAAAEVAFLGVGPLYDFRYPEIHRFGLRTLGLIKDQRPGVRTVGMTIHGVGYGLDEREAFLSQLRGMIASEGYLPPPVERILIIERDPNRAARLRQIVDGLVEMPGDRTLKPATVPRDLIEALRPPSLGEDPVPDAPSEAVVTLAKDALGTATPSEIARESEQKPRLFVAMPFAERHQDAFDIAFSDAAHAHGFLCERLDLEPFTGDVVAEIRRRIEGAAGVIALLNDLNPNVFLEIGYAMALEKPIIFVALEGTDLPFDIRNFRRIEYTRIFELREKLIEEIEGLTSNGVIERTG